MNKPFKAFLLLSLLFTLIISIVPKLASANSAEPPSLTILVTNPPDDLSIILVSGENQQKPTVRRVAWEGYYSFYSRHMRTDGEYKLKVTTNGESFEFTLGSPLKGYNNVFTLDISNRQFTPGKYPFRSAILVSIRLTLTLLLEGIIFWLFGFRKKRSWVIFLIINLVTQGALNITLNSGGSLMPSYLILGLIFGEFFVFITEMLAYPIFINEHKRLRSLIFAFTANLISLIAGGYIISVLPV